MFAQSADLNLAQAQVLPEAADQSILKKNKKPTPQKKTIQKRAIASKVVAIKCVIKERKKNQLKYKPKKQFCMQDFFIHSCKQGNFFKAKNTAGRGKKILK